MARRHQEQLLQRNTRRARRAEDLPVRQWLKLGAASAGMGAALLGFSLMGPSTGTALADSTTESSAASSTTDSPKSRSGSDSTAGAANATGAKSDPSADDDSADGGAADGGAADDGSADDGAADDDAADDDAEDADVEDADVEDTDTVDEGSADTDSAETNDAAPVATDTVAPTKDRTPARAGLVTAVPPAGAAEENEDEPAPQPRDPVTAPSWLAPPRTWNDVVADVIDRWTTGTQAWIDSLPADDEAKAKLEATLWAVRRTFFNQAPTVAPVQLTGLISGEITGRIAGEDADGDPISYRLIRGPKSGSVTIADDGTYIYTPNDDFDGVDTFYVSVVDAGVHINLLNLLRPHGTRVDNLINQGAIKFEFNYDGADWTEERRAALEEAAAQLQEYFRVNKPVTLTYDVNVETKAKSLASAGSPYISEAAGYWRTVVQEKLLTGRDANGDKADGGITWNFKDYEWELGEDVSAEEYDFVSTVIHELMHSFGFLSSLEGPGKNDGANRVYFDRYMVTARGLSPFLFSTWPRFNDPKLTGQDGGLYFGGANAVAAYGGLLVPIYVPAEWEDGSAGSHLDDITFTGDNQQVMNAQTDSGPGKRVFSAVEIGILKDLGYNVVMPESPPYSMALVGFVFFAAKRGKRKLAAR